LKIKSVGDLLRYFPSRYQAAGKIKKISESEKGDNVLLRGKILEIKLQKTWRKKINIAEAKFSDAGFCKTFIAREKETTFIGGRGLESLVFGKETLTKVGVRVKEIEKLKETEKDGKERDLMDKRISALLGGIATIYVDAKTVAERYYLKLKVEDAMNSCKGALNDGMVKGGGATLKEIADELGETSLLYNALLKPYDRIIQNNLGKEFDLKEVYDSYLVVKAAVANAVSVVKVLITIEGIIANKEKDVEK